MEEIVKELTEEKNVRQNLSELRKWLREGGSKEELFARVKENEELFFSFLSSEDAKTRKNAALLFGDLAYTPAIRRLYEAYEAEETLFVKSAYLEALAGCPGEELDEELLWSDLKEREHLLQSFFLSGDMGGEPSNRKHREEELRALRQLLICMAGIPYHGFDVSWEDNTVLLVTNRLHRTAVRDSVCEKSATVIKTELHPLGVSVRTADMTALLAVRTYRELLFVNPKRDRGLVSGEETRLAKSVASWLLALCEKYLGRGPFYFRVDLGNSMTLEERSSFARRLGMELEICSGGALINSPGDYEVELRLIRNKEGNFFPCVKLMALPDHRFDYRKNAVSASIHPSTAALIMELAKPYLKEGAQVLDPFCGVGTMLIERDIAVPAGDKYGTDIFGDAIIFGRENAALAKEQINFIHRDFFDFRHEYLFDEIMTNMPMRGKKTKEEQDELYARFFARAASLLAPNGVIVMYTNETGFVKKQLRLHGEYELLQETPMSEKLGFSLMIMKKKG